MTKRSLWILLANAWWMVGIAIPPGRNVDALLCFAFGFICAAKAK